MATYTWTTKAGGNWNTGTDWTPTSGPPGGVAPDTDVAIIQNLNANYTVAVQAGTSFNIATLDFGSTTGTLPALQISGTLDAGTLAYTGSKALSLEVNTGGLLDIGSTISSTLAETMLVSGTGTGGHLIQGNMSTAVNSHVTDKFSDSLGINSGGEIEFASGFTNGGTLTQSIQGVAWGNTIVIDGANFAAGDTATLSGSSLIVKSSGGSPVFTISDVGTLAHSSPTFIVSGDDITAVCYARGTMIATPDGETPIERLRAGKQVVTLADGQAVIRHVKWLGHRRIDLATHPRPETVAPIRILRGAFAEQMPHRDLLLSPDHAVLADGKLICARQLINGTTIRQETGWTSVDYYHVELEDHAILVAEGLPAESYIDTGNSGFFDNSGAPLALHPDLTDETDYPTREAGSCAPFVWDEASVRPVWQRLADRAATIGRPVPQRATTHDAGLHLIAKGNRAVKPVYGDKGLVIFALPHGATEVRLVSRAQSPTAARPWLEDRRTLGIRVARIVLRSAEDLREVPVDHPDLANGWWAVERDGIALRRWTNGEAVLPLPTMDGAAMLEVHLGGEMTYLADDARLVA